MRFFLTKKNMTTAWTLCLFCLSAGLALEPLQKGQIDSLRMPVKSAHYLPEYTFDTPVDTTAWLQLAGGLHASFVATDQAWFRSEVPVLENESLVMEEVGWQGERLNAMILVWSPDTLRQVRFHLNDLTSDSGETIAKSAIRLRMVRYVLSDYPYNADNATCNGSPHPNGYLLPDRLEPFERFDVPGKTVRPVWLTIDIPAATKPGIYKGEVEVRALNYAKRLFLQIRVQNQVLPKPHDWKFRLDLWQNPWVIAWYYHVQPWSDEHKALLKKHLELYADAGGTYITTYAVHSPWADNSYMIEGTMIDWIRTKAGAWKFDYSIFDQYIELAMSVGIDEAITVYTPLPWGNRFRYLDEATGDYVYEIWPPDSEQFKSFWGVFLTDLKAHLEKKGWFEKTYLGINENEMSQTLAAIDVIKKHDLQWKITYAGDWHPELDHLLDDYCCVYTKEPGLANVQERSERGFTSTFYVCCYPARPNNFVFSPPAEGQWLGWYAAAHGYDGFLRWAYDAWPADPARDARHGWWGAGDCFLVYPGGNSSIRFEKLREGIVDYEKIRLLKKLASRSSDEKIIEQVNDLDDLLRSFVVAGGFDVANAASSITKGRKLLEDLSDKLSR